MSEPGFDLAYDMPLYRPPSEGSNLILQVTLGCSFNRCTFCSMYKTKEFAIKPLESVFAEIDAAAHLYPDANRIFLADGDALVLPLDHLCAILERLSEKFPELARVSSYALPANLLKKSVEELAELKARKLSLLYYGVESGSDEVLKRIRKGATSAAMIEGLGKAREAGLKTSCTVILGLGGQKRWREHMEETANLLSVAAPTYASTLQLMLEEGQREEFLESYGENFQFQDDEGILKELELLVSRMTPQSPVIFRSNHASNALALAGTLPKDREKLLGEIRRAMGDITARRPAWMRGL